jgi:tetratricopeptide (TPR) repeat protein
MKLKDIYEEKNIKVFIVTEQDYDNELNWTIEQTDFELIPEEGNYYFVSAFEVSQNEKTDCYIGIMTPERIADFVIKQNANGQATVESIYHQEKSIIPAIASECSGYYGLFYANENPQIGIDILKSGLPIAKNKNVIAEDLGYLLLDEERIEEAIEAFRISEENCPSTEYTFWELAKLYEKIGQMDKQSEYIQKFKDHCGIKQMNIGPNS